MKAFYHDFLIRDWQPFDRQPAADLIASVLQEYGLSCEPDGADRDVLQVEAAYWASGGEFWVVEQNGQLVGTAGYYPVARGNQSVEICAVEIRKMYLLPVVRGKGLGQYLLQTLEATIAAKGFKQIWVETATVLKAAVILYERNGYLPATGVETARCDRIYLKELGDNG